MPAAKERRAVFARFFVIAARGSHDYLLVHSLPQFFAHALVALVFAGVLGVPRSARAEPARLDYSAPTGCPTEAEFVRRVRERGGNFDAPSAAGSVLFVSIREEAGAFSGSVKLRSDGTSSEPREVRSPQCEEAADGLAVVVAISLQGKAQQPEPSGASSPAAGATSATPSPAPVPPPQKPAPPVTKPEPRKLTTKGQWVDEAIPVSAGEVGVLSDVAVTASGGAAFGLVPGVVTPRFDLTLARTNFITTPAGEGFIVGGIVRVRWTLLGPMRHEIPGFSTDILAFKAGVSGCSQLSYDRAGLVLIHCGEIAAGVADVVTTSDAGEETQEEQTQGFGTAGFELSARYNLSSLFHLDLSAGGELWLAALAARRPDGGVIFRTNPFMGYVTAGFGLHF